MYLTLNKLPFVSKVDATRNISDPNILYSKITKTMTLAITLPTVPYRLSFKVEKANPKIP